MPNATAWEDAHMASRLRRRAEVEKDFHGLFFHLQLFGSFQNMKIYPRMRTNLKQFSL